VAPVRYGAGMTKVDDQVRDGKVINEALAVIDKALGEMLNRELVSTDEVADLLLDVRLLLTASASSTTEA